MSYLNTKQALISKLLSSSISGIDTSSIAYENNVFDPASKDAFIETFFLPASTESTGKTIASSDEDRGIFQISVYVQYNGGDYDNLQLQIIDSLRKIFANTTSSTYEDQQVDIMESEVNQGSISSGWFKRDMSVNYITFSKRA